jgi:hypothetical protein
MVRRCKEAEIEQTESLDEQAAQGSGITTRNNIGA